MEEPKPVTPSITVGLLNWARPENLQRILAVLTSQTLRPAIFLWNNAGVLGEFDPSQVDWYVGSTRNAVCPPRWWMLSHAETPYVMTLDDDVLPTDNRLIADVVACLDTQPARRAIGPYGTIFTNPAYFPHTDIGLPSHGTPVDLVKGRSMMLRRDDLRDCLRLGDLAGDGGVEDIAVCGALAEGHRRRHLVPSIFHGRFRELPQGPEALEKSPDWAKRRNAARRKWFPHA